MAILQTVPGVEAVVLIDGDKAQEYVGNKEHPYPDVSVVRYIASVEDAKFAVRILVNDEYNWEKPRQNGLGIRVFVDGIQRCNTTWPIKRTEHMLLTGTKSVTADGGTAVAGFTFKAVKIVDGTGDDIEKDIIKQQRLETEDAGEIIVQVERVRLTAVVRGQGLAKGNDNTKQEKPDELLLKADQGRNLTHVTRFGAEVPSAKTTKKYKGIPLDGPGNPIATFVFMCRSKDVLDELRVSPVTEELPMRKKADELFVQQSPVGNAARIKTEPNAAQGDDMSDIYGATPPPQRQSQAPTQAAAPAPASGANGTMENFQRLLQSIGLTDEQKRLLAQQLLGNNDAAQNAQASRTGQAAATPGPDGVRIKQEHDQGINRGASLTVSIPNRNHSKYTELQTEQGLVVDLTSPVEEHFIKPDPDAAVGGQDDIADAQAAADIADNASSSTVSGTGILSDNGQADGRMQAVTATAPHQGIENDLVDTSAPRQGSISTADGIATPRTPDAPVQEPAFERADETQIHNDTSDAMVLDKATPKEAATSFEADVIASIEAADHTNSVTEPVRRRQDSIASDVSLDLNTVLQGARSSRPTITTTADTGMATAISPTPPLAQDTKANAATEFLVAPSAVDSRAVSTDGSVVQTVDVDMSTGYDIRHSRGLEDSMSPSRQLIGSLENDEDDDYEIIDKPVEDVDHSIVSISHGSASNKPTEGFAAAMALAAGQSITKSSSIADSAATTFEVEVPNTPGGAQRSSPTAQAEVHTGDHGFIDLEAIVPQTPVKHHTPGSLTKMNSMLNTPTPITPSTVERLGDMGDLNLNSPPLKRLFFGQRTPGSKVDSPAAGKENEALKKTPIKREREDGEEFVELLDTPSKKMRYPDLGTVMKPIQLDSDDELPDFEAKPDQARPVSYSGDNTVAQLSAEDAAQNDGENRCVMM